MKPWPWPSFERSWKRKYFRKFLPFSPKTSTKNSTKYILIPTNCHHHHQQLLDDDGINKVAKNARNLSSSKFLFCLLLSLAFSTLLLISSYQNEHKEDIKMLKRQNDWTRMCAGNNITSTELARLFPPFTREEKYVASWNGTCGGIGNQMYRFASLYGIGRPYGRRPIFKEEERCLQDHLHEIEIEDEFEHLFPVYASQLKFIQKMDPRQTLVLKGFAPGCCSYADPQSYNFSAIKQKYVQVEGMYLQSYKFFEGRRAEMRQIFQFGPQVCAYVEAYAQALFGDDHSHKLCVHARIEDFVGPGWASKKEFAEKAIHFALGHLKFASQSKVGQAQQLSVVLIGADKKFLKGLSIDRRLIPQVYMPKPMPRGHDLCFGTTVCDSLLITASASTFAWWIAYLMPDTATIFYDSDLETKPHRRVNFLPEWIPIRLEDGTIIYD